VPRHAHVHPTRPKHHVNESLTNKPVNESLRATNKRMSARGVVLCLRLCAQENTRRQRAHARQTAGAFHAHLIFTQTPKLPVARFAFCLLGNDVCNSESRHPGIVQSLSNVNGFDTALRSSSV